MADEVKKLTKEELIQRFVTAVKGAKDEEMHILLEEILQRMEQQKAEREKEALDEEHFEESHPMRGSFGGNTE